MLVNTPGPGRRVDRVPPSLAIFLSSPPRPAAKGNGLTLRFAAAQARLHSRVDFAPRLLAVSRVEIEAIVEEFRRLLEASVDIDGSGRAIMLEIRESIEEVESP